MLCGIYKVCRESCRVASEVADKLSAWSPQQQGSGGALPARQLVAAVLQTTAAAAVAKSLVSWLAQPRVTDVSSTGSSTAFRVLSACCRVLLVPAADMLQPVGRVLPRLPLFRIFTFQCMAVLSTAFELLLALTNATRGGSMARTAQAVIAVACSPTALNNFWKQSVQAVANLWQQSKCRLLFQPEYGRR